MASSAAGDSDYGCVDYVVAVAFVVVFVSFADSVHTISHNRI